MIVITKNFLILRGFGCALCATFTLAMLERSGQPILPFAVVFDDGGKGLQIPVHRALGNAKFAHQIVAVHAAVLVQGDNNVNQAFSRAAAY